MKKFGWIFLRLLLGVLAIWGSMNLCTTTLYPLYAKDVREYAKSNIRPFNPSYFKELGHMAIPFTITPEGLLSLDKESRDELQLRPGSPPYHPGGDTEVVYYKCIDTSKKCIGSNLEEIGRYFIEDPTKGRSCDLTDKRGGKVFNLKEGVDVELLFPANPNISSIVIIYADKDPQVFDVSKIVMKVFEKTPKKAMR